MDSEIVIPRLGLTMETGRIVEWYKQDGTSVTAGEPLFAIETDKAVQDVPAEATGILHRTPGVASDPLPIGTVIGHIRTPAAEPAVRVAADKGYEETPKISQVTAVFMPKMSDFMEIP